MRLPVNHALPLAALILLGACSPLGGDGPRSTPVPSHGPAADYPMVIGEPYAIGGVTYTPEDRLNYDAVGYADAGTEGGGGISIAHKTLPLPSYVEITSLDSGRTILARAERRGPMTNDRLIELSPAAAAQLGVEGAQKLGVRVRRVNPPEPERALLRSGQRAPERMETPKSLLGVLKRKLEPEAAAPSPALPNARADAPAAAQRRLPPRKTLPGTAPATAPSPAPSPAASAPSPAPAEPTAAANKDRTGSLVVQAGAFSSRERADAAAAALGGFVDPAGRLFRVRIGPFASQGAARAALAKARGAGYSDARIQPVR